MFVNRATLLMFAAMPAENVDICCWMFSRKEFDFGAHRPIFLMSVSFYPAIFGAHAPPNRNKCVSTRSSGMPRSGYFS